MKEKLIAAFNGPLMYAAELFGILFFFFEIFLLYAMLACFAS